MIASQSANTVKSIKLLDGQYGQSEKQTLRELYRVHFPGSAGKEVTLEGQGQPKLSICRSQGGPGTVYKGH
jgi:hypothetical protein